MNGIENWTCEALQPGQTARRVRTLTDRDIQLHAVIAAEASPGHADAALADRDPFRRVTAPGCGAARSAAPCSARSCPGRARC